MGGKSSSQTQQSTVSSPWAPTQAGLQGIIGQIQGQLPNTAMTGTEQNAFANLEGNAGNPFTGQINSFANDLLNGGGANAQAGNISDALASYKSQLMPWATGAMGDPSQNPALRQMLDVIGADTTNSINSQFAGAGRDLSGMNQQAIARGLAQGEAPILLNAQQMGLNAAGNLYNAGNTTAGLLSGLTQQGLANQQAGVGAAQSALDASNYTPERLLAIESAKRGLPLSNIGALSNLLVPIAALGGQSSGNATTTKTASPLEQALGVAKIGSLFFGGR